MRKNIAYNQTRKRAEQVLEILERQDGLSFEEKKAEALILLNDCIDATENAIDKENTKAENGINASELVWKAGSILYSDDQIILRQVAKEDKSGFLEVQQEHTGIPAMFAEETFKAELWSEHISAPALMCSIIHSVTKEYIGYCGIKDSSLKKWEIAIELHKDWCGKGIGYISIQKFLDEIAMRTGIKEFRVRVNADNYASQGLFEKLGAIPNGISEFLIYGEKALKEFEEENLQYIDDKLIAVGEKFHVEPRKLLSHVLEYKLIWNR